MDFTFMKKNLGTVDDYIDRFSLQPLLPALAGIPTVVCSLYCLLVWAPMQGEFSWFNLDISLICWAFCSTGISGLAYLAMAIGLASVLSGFVAGRSLAGRYALAISGVFLLPLGLVNFIVLKKPKNRSVP